MFLLIVRVKTEVMDEHCVGQASIEDGSDVSPYDISEISADGSDKWSVILFDDSHHSMDYVTWALLKTLPQLSPVEASLIMLEAHNTGTGVVIVCGLSEAERYRADLRVLQLRCDIQPGW